MVGMICVAAGYGSLGSVDGKPYPKVLEKVDGLPMIVRQLIAVESADITDVVVTVNPRDAEDVMRVVHDASHAGWLGFHARFAVQENRRGAADAVMQAIPLLQRREDDRVLIAYPDMPNWRSRTLRELVVRSRCYDVVTMVTVKREQRFPVLDTYGRVVRNRNKDIERIVEYKSPAATPEELAASWVNPSLWVWNSDWLSRSISRIPPFKKTDGYDDELHMPPLVGMAYREGYEIGEYQLPPGNGYEALGVNSLDDLRAAGEYSG